MRSLFACALNMQATLARGGPIHKAGFVPSFGELPATELVLKGDSRAHGATAAFRLCLCDFQQAPEAGLYLIVT